ncbi:EAL domain-containing protein [Nitrospina gracilis]|uniref:EAL domain-containing protein n=1 Tax=Nitrospina gracilis TaxID=35801 RepID=UPI001F1D4C66|nr:EAL domain-containing protein [Nitrospina gracilis]MCF8719853.1 diguanylate cyclase (GGDEF)-like protein/PAS domain S-box-containing protein [Nitrospina gracilis Nb-211]
MIPSVPAFRAAEEKKLFLKRIDLMTFLPEETLDALAADCSEIVLDANTVLFEKGDTGKSMYILLEGEVLIYIEKKNLATLKPGAYFGEMSLIECQPRTASAKTLVPSTLIEIDEELFSRYFANQPRALMAMMRNLSARSRKISADLAASLPAMDEESGIDPIAFMNDTYLDVLLFDLETFKFTQANAPACREVGYSPEDLFKMHFLDLAISLDQEDIDRLFEPLIQSIRPMTVFEAVYRRKNGSTYPVECRCQIVKNLGTHPQVMVWSQDITERKQLEEQIRQMAYYDPLTGLLNRNLLNDRLEVALTSANVANEKVGILFLDLDHFKTINDTLGHDMGDLLLKQVADRLKKMARQEDTVARMGGDEFVIIVPNLTKEDEIVDRAQKILEALTPIYNIQNHELYITCSIGISVFPDDGQEIETLLKHSDLAMYRAKERGRNTFQFFAQSMNTLAVERMIIEKNMRKAMGGTEFQLYYQPKVCLRTGKVVGMEALLRWENPELGFVNPQKSIPIAEETRLIIQIGRWIIESACQQIKRLEKINPDINIAVNLSVIQFNSPDLVSEIKGIIRDTGIDPQKLQVEVTESILIQDSTLAISILQNLNDLGIKICIDDFGTGYSSLSYLKNMPIDYLKVDQSFIRDLTDPTNEAITRAVVALAQSLGMKTIAEGVETNEQKNFLQMIHCDEGQGYLFSKPLEAHRAEELLKKGFQVN